MQSINRCIDFVSCPFRATNAADNHQPLLLDGVDILAQLLLHDSVAMLAIVCKLVESLGTPPLFVEPPYEDMAARTISRETGAALFAPDPIVTVPADAPLTYYEDMMRQNAAVPAGALGD